MPTSAGGVWKCCSHCSNRLGLQVTPQLPAVGRDNLLRYRNVRTSKTEAHAWPGCALTSIKWSRLTRFLNLGSCNTCSALTLGSLALPSRRALWEVSIATKEQFEDVQSLALKRVEVGKPRLVGTVVETALRKALVRRHVGQEAGRSSWVSRMSVAPYFSFWTR